MHRRDFVSTSGLGLLGTVAASRSLSSRVLGANDRILCGFIGLGGMGRANLTDFLKCEKTEVAAVCDVWQPNLDRARKMAGGAVGYQDFHRILDRKDIDAVVISTPDHWHAYMAIQACRAGKDVYVEKPLAHNIREGRLMVEAARQNKRVVQVGTQQRSGSHYRAVVEYLQAGKIGKVGHVAAWNFENQSPHGIGTFPDGPNPLDLDYDLWLGPAPKRAFNPNRFIYNFRFFWDYAGGHATDWGVHHVDIVQWAMNEHAPRRVSAFGGRYVLNDDRETPDTLDAIFEFSNFTYSYSNRLVNANPLYGRPFGIAFYGADGTLIVDRAGYEVLPENRGVFEQPAPVYKRELESASATEAALRWSQDRNVRKGRTQNVLADASEQHLSHVKNFLECLRSRQAPASDVEVAHHSTATVHLANISLRTGRTIVWDSKNEQVPGDTEAAQYLSRSYREPWIVS